MDENELSEELGKLIRKNLSSILRLAAMFTDLRNMSLEGDFKKQLPSGKEKKILYRLQVTTENTE